MEYLLKLGADPNATTSQGVTPLMMNTNNSSIVELLINAGGDLNRVSADGKLAFHLHLDDVGNFFAMSILFKIIINFCYLKIVSRSYSLFRMVETSGQRRSFDGCRSRSCDSPIFRQVCGVSFVMQVLY